MKNRKFAGAVVIVLLTMLVACKKQSDETTYPSLAEYYPLQVGKVFYYRLDSTIRASFGSSLYVKSYQAMDSIAATFTDSAGRSSYLIYRLLRDSAGTQPWSPAYTLVATVADKQIEYVENNLRFIKLHEPIKNDFAWTGNSYIDTKTNIPNVWDFTYFDNWNYTYQNFDETFTYGGFTYNNSVTVAQQDEFSPDGPFDPTLDYQQRNYSKEVYAKGQGLVYKELLHWTWQKPEFGDDSYGVKMWLTGKK